jgi:hypothetical protein
MSSPDLARNGRKAVGIPLRNRVHQVKTALKGKKAA